MNKIHDRYLKMEEETSISTEYKFLTLYNFIMSISLIFLLNSILNVLLYGQEVCQK